MNTPYTPGPWKLNFENSNEIVADFGGQDITVALAHGPAGMWGEVQYEHAANARLIAAAPELLEACKFALQKCISLRESGDAGFYPEQPEEIMLKKVIAKAEGGI